MIIYNPTDKQLRTLKGIIYLFRNRINGKCYVGKTINKFIDRYVGNRWWEKPANTHIKHSVQKHGLENFEIYIIENGVFNKELLGTLETYYIRVLNTMHPNGYNYLEGGNEMKHTEESRNLIAENGAKDFVFFNHKTEKLVNVHNLAKFCRENNLSGTMMTNVSTGKYKRHKEYTLPGQQIKKWEIISPEGKPYIILEGELRNFCKKNNLHRFTVNRICNGKQKEFKGWTCPKFKL